MELKDMILSTLAELDEVESKQAKMSFETSDNTNISNEATQQQQKSISQNKASNEVDFLNGVRERVLVLFEGLQSPQNQNLETKIDITLNFLEFLLALIEDRLKVINSNKK